MDFIKLSIEELATLSKKSKDEVLSLSKNEDGSEKTEAEISKAAAQLIRDRFGQIGTENLGRGTREALTKKQRELVAKYGITEDKPTLEDLVDAIIEAEKAKNTTQGDSAQLTEKIEEIKRLKEEVKQNKLKLTETEKAREKDKISMRVEARALAEIEKLNLVFPADEKAAERAKRMLLDSILKANFKIENDAIVPLDENGQPMQTDGYENIDFSTFVKNSNFLPTKAAENNTPNPPNPKGGGGNNSSFKFAPADLEASAFVAKSRQLMQEGKHDEVEALKKAFSDKVESQKKA